MFEGLERLTEKHEIGVTQNYWYYGRDSNPDISRKEPRMIPLHQIAR
jgi:hypothetical protein